MSPKKIIFFSALAFIGYLIGRWSHAYWNDWLGNPVAPHHWIYGALLIMLGLTFRKRQIGKVMFFFGIGLFFSDLIDFFHFRIFNPDAVGPKNFWGID